MSEVQKGEICEHITGKLQQISFLQVEIQSELQECMSEAEPEPEVQEENKSKRESEQMSTSKETFPQHGLLSDVGQTPLVESTSDIAKLLAHTQAKLPAFTSQSLEQECCE